MGSSEVRRFRTRSTTVEAIQFTGFNLCEIEEALREVTGRNVSLGSMMDVGCWVTIAPSYQVLPNKHFMQVYEPADGPVNLSVQVVPIPVAKTCFTCIHHFGTRCQLFDEQIDSEIYAAADCSGYEYDGDKDV